MTDTVFIDTIVHFYLEARCATIPRTNIRRGMSHKISSYTEDLFASYIDDISSPELILIEQPFSYLVDGKTIIMKPDIAIIKNNKIVSIFEIKQDLGFCRDFFPYCERQVALLNMIKGTNVKATDGQNKDESFNYTVSDDIKCNVIIISNMNIGKVKRDRNLSQISTLDKNKLEVFILTEDVHPNTYHGNISDMKIRTADFSNLRNEINKL